MSRRSFGPHRLLRKCCWLACLIFLVKGAAAQSISQDIILPKFQEFTKKSLQEKIYVHTDKNLYLPGEILWFKAYEVGAGTNAPIDFSKVVYTEILDKDNQAVMQAKNAIVDGTANGSLHLPVDLVSGTYRIRSYTNWMKNFSPDYFFEKPIYIVNTLAKPGKPATEINLTYDVQFFPEGGDLVEGLASKIAFRATDSNGKGIDFKGSIIDESNDTIARFSPSKFGIGSFILNPGTNKNYQAVIQIPGKQNFNKLLPVIKKNGYVMTVQDLPDNKINLSLSSNNSGSQQMLLLVHTRQETKISEKIIVNGGKGEFQIDKNKLGDGISHFTVFNSSGQPVSERLYFKRPASKLVFSIKPDQQQFGKRKKVTIDLEAKTEAGMFSDADASISVYATNGFESNSTDIVNYLWLKSDLKGNVEDPAYYFRSADVQTNEALDNLMLTHGWRRFLWEDVVSSKVPGFEFLPEIDGHIITGKITDTRTNSPAKEILTYLSVPGKSFQLYTARSSNSGDLKFYTRDIHGPSELVAQTNYMQDSTYHIELTSPFVSKFADYQTSGSSLNDEFRNQLLTQSVGNQVQNVFLGDKLRTFYARPADSASFYLKPDNSYLLDNFVRFNTMEEVLREYIPEIPVTRQKDDFSLWIAFRPHYNDYYKNVEPLIVFDGVPVFERGTKMVRVDPKKVRTIEVLTKKYYLGPSTFNSIINFKSYKNNLPDFQLDTRATVVDYEGTQLKREFYAPVYETAEQIADRMPDFRTLLYWSPEVKIDASGKKTISFYTSDQKSKYTVVLQGISSSGKPGSSELSLEVK